MGRAGAVAAILLLLAGTPLAVAQPDLDCGEFSPFENSCFSPAAVYHGGELSMTAAMLTFLGRLDITVTGRTSGSSVHWMCWSLLLPNAAPGTTSACTGPDYAGTFVLNELLDMTCVASGTYGPGLPTKVGPDGSWGCKVHVPD